MFNICLVEDEKSLNNLIKTYLESAGYNVIQCFSGKEALELTTKIHLWILDIMLSDDISGYDIIKKIRETDDKVPVIFTSARDQDLDKIIGLELGSDDYITKPYSPKELVLRVNNIIKRVYKDTFDKITYEDYKINVEKRTVTLFDKEIKLTTLEFELLLLFVNNVGKSFSREEILNSINSFKGEYSQIPPMYSALKQNGVRLYELARKGIEVERKGRLINIHNLEDIKINNPYISMKVTCSKGTYIRSLCYDIGEKLGVFATMTQLNRAKTSVFSQEKSININELTKENINDYILSMEEALEKYDKIVVNKKYVKLLVNGVRVADGRFTKDKVINNKLYRVYDDENNFIGLGERNDAGFKIEKLLIT